jgi:hypothetical protein
MGIQVVWDDDAKTIIRYSFERSWTWAEFETAQREAHAKIDTVTHKVGVIIGGPADATLPLNMLSHIRSGLRNKHPRTCVAVLLIYTPFQRALFNAAISLTRRSSAIFHAASSVDEARALITAHLRELNRLVTPPER